MTEVFLISTGLSTVIAGALSLLLGHLTAEIAGLSLLLGLGAGLGHWFVRLRGRSMDSLPFGTVDILIFLFFSGFIYIQFIYLYYQSDLLLNIGNQNNLGDLPFHINLIKSFSRGIQFWPENIEWSGVPLRYPFGMDLFNALLETLGVRTQAHLFIVGIVCSFFLLRELRLYSGLFLVLAFFLSGGSESFGSIFQGSGAWSTSLVDFKNLFLSVYVTQRGFLWALPAGLYLLRQWEKISESNYEISELAVFCFVLALMPLFHLHTAFFLFVYFLLRVLVDFVRYRKIDKVRFSVYGVALLGASPLLAKFLVGGGGQVSNALGWMEFWNWHQGSIFEYWMQNFFFLTLLLPALLYASWRQRYISSVVSVFVFILFVKVKLAPWAWDNIKLIIWAYIVLIRDFETVVLAKLKTTKVLLGLIFFVPGFYQLLSSLPVAQHVAGYTVPASILSCGTVAKGFDINDAVVMAPDYEHPLLFLGVKSYVGFEGHVWSHGYDLTERRGKVANLLRLIQEGSSTVGAEAKSMGVKWLSWGPREIHYFRKNFNLELDPSVLQKYFHQPVCDAHLQSLNLGLQQSFTSVVIGEQLYDLTKY